MNIKFIGVGNAFTTSEYWQSNLLLSEGSNNLLIDCGSDIRHSIKEQIKTINNGNIHEHLSAIYISHVHADHIGGLEWIGFCTYFNPKANKIDLIFHEDINNDLWNESLKGGMKNVQNHPEMKLEDYFKVNILKEQLGFYFSGKKCIPVKSIHVKSEPPKLSYGLFISSDKKVYWTADSIFNPNTKEYNEADLILQDCETSKFPSTVHPHYKELVTLPSEIKKKMWLYHYTPEYIDYDAIKDGFAGFVKKGQSFDI